MELTRTHIALITAMVLVGGGLVIVGLIGGLGLMWTAAGLFFLAVAATALMTTLSHTIDGPIGAFLRRRELRVVMVVVIVVLLVLTVITSGLNRTHPG